MDVCYNKLFKILIDKGIKKTQFAKMAGVGMNTMAKLARNEMVSLEVMVRICRALSCTLDEVIDILPENKTEIVQTEEGNEIY